MEKWFHNKSFSTKKWEQGIKARKGHRDTNVRKIHHDINARKLHCAFGVLLAAVLLFRTMPFEGIAVSASENSGGGLCEHHRSHTPDCGYQEAGPGHACIHEHTDECYRAIEEEDGSTTKELDCHHEHDESCGYQEAAEGSPCIFVCEICNGRTDEPSEDKMDGNEINDENSENPGTENEIKEPDDGQEECICEEPCKEDNGNDGCRINMDCPVCGAEDASLSDCKGKDAEENTEDVEENTDQPEDTGICKHHREHDEDCGYQPASEDGEGSPCTYDCRICSVEKLIAALPDVADITEDNADEVKAQLHEILALFAELTEDEQGQIDLSLCYDLQEALDAAKTPVTADEIPEDAVAKIEKKGAETVCVTADELGDAFAQSSSNAGATITLLDNVERKSDLHIGIDCTLNLNGHTIHLTGDYAYVDISSKATVTIQGEGGIVSEKGNALGVAGNVTLEGGTFTSNGAGYAGVNVIGSLSVTGENVMIQNTSGSIGLAVNTEASVQLSAGKYYGETAAIEIYSSKTLGDLLGHTDNTRYAYFDSTGATPFMGKMAETALTGTVTVQRCEHTGDGVCEYTHSKGTTTHQQTCLACGYVKTEENCSYIDGKCACGSTLVVALTNTEKLVYDGNPHEPGVAVTLDGAKLTAADYDVTYNENIKAGTDTATITVTGKKVSCSFEIKKTFSIEKAEQKDFAVVEETMQYEKNGTFILSATGGGGDGAVLYRVPENNGVLMVNGDKATIIGVGTVPVTAAKAESDNYKEATATGIITIEKASAPAITYPTAGSIIYGQKLSESALTGGSTEYGTFAWKDGSMAPSVGGTTGYAVVFTASEETEKNYETITNSTQNVSVKVEQAVPTVSITAAVSGSKDNRQAVLTVNVAKAGAGAFPTGTVKLMDCTGSTEREIGTVTLNSSGTASYTWDGLSGQTYTIKAVYAGNNNYTDASREFTFDAAKQNQQDFALDAIGAKTYGDAAISLKTTGGSGSGAVRYESSDKNVVRIEDGKAVIAGAGTATITAIKAEDDNYNEASASRNVTVAKKALTVSADSKTVVRGNPMPALTYRADGLVNGDTFTAAPSIKAGAQDTNTLGKYDIVISGGTLRNSESYRITYVNGTLHIVGHIFTVAVADGTGGGEYAEGDTVTVTANDRSGYTFTGWSSEDGIGFADSKAKTTTFTMPAKSVTVKANFTRNSSGGDSGDGGNSGGAGGNSASGGNAGDNGSDGGQDSGGNDSTNPGNGNTAPQIPVIPPAENANPGNEATPGTGTTPVNPGIANTSRPGTGSGSGTGTPIQGTKQPFIKGEDGKIGWDVIRAEEEKAQEGSVINVDMNGSAVVPGDVFDSIKGKDITITFDMGSGILWSVDGKSIATDKAGDIDFSVKTGVNTVPVDIVNNVTGESYNIQISLAYEGEFGFTAVLSIDLGRENAGFTASLYYYDKSADELEFISKEQIAEDGTASLAFTHASDYVIAIDGEQEEGNDAVETVQPEENGGTVGNGTAAEKTPQEGQQWRSWWLVVAGVLVLVTGVGVCFILKKKGDED